LAWNGTKVRRNWRFSAHSITETQMHGTVCSKLVFRASLQGTLSLSPPLVPSLTPISRIDQFKALRRLSSLPLSPLKPSSKLHEDLASRGKVYVTLSGVRFLQYDGVLSQEVGYGMNKTIIKLRVRSDFSSFRGTTELMRQKKVATGRWKSCGRCEEL